MITVQKKKNLAQNLKTIACFMNELISAQTLLYMHHYLCLTIITVSFSVTRLHEQSLHFEKITFFMSVRALKYYIISK